MSHLIGHWSHHGGSTLGPNHLPKAPLLTPPHWMGFSASIYEYWENTNIQSIAEHIWKLLIFKILFVVSMHLSNFLESWPECKIKCLIHVLMCSLFPIIKGYSWRRSLHIFGVSISHEWEGFCRCAPMWVRKGGENKSRRSVVRGLDSSLKLAMYQQYYLLPFEVYFVCLTLKSNAQPVGFIGLWWGIKWACVCEATQKTKCPENVPAGTHI